MNTPQNDPDSLEDVLDSLNERVTWWAGLSDRAVAELLARVRADTWRVAPAWHRASCEAKGLDPESAEGAEELLAGVVMFARLAEVYERTLRHPRGEVRGSKVRVLPATWSERLLFAGLSAQVWRDDSPTLVTHPGVAVVLGAGNVASLTPRDVLHHVVVERRVVLVKANPVNDYLVEHWAGALRALVEVGVVAFTSGDALYGQRLIRDSRVSAVHLTGSARTAALIAPELRPGVEFTSELGSVTPVIVVPGRWTRRQMRYQVDHVASMVVNNAGCNCVTPRVLVLSRDWPQRAQFQRLLEARLLTLGSRPAFYPGARERQGDFLKSRPDATVIGLPTESELPWVISWGHSSTETNDAFTEEYFCPALVGVELDETDPVAFLRAAQEFVTSRVWGTLAVTMLIDPATRRRPGVSEVLDDVVEALAYGVVAVNAFHALGIGLGSTTWGAAPGADPSTGRGVVSNGLLVPGARRSVVEGRFTTPWTPPWFITRPRGTTIAWRFLSWVTRHRLRDLLALTVLVLSPR